MTPPPAFTDLKCRNCGAALSAGDISPQLGAARCGHCRSLFALPTSSPASIPRPEVPLPAAFTMEMQGETLVITRRWRNLSVWFLLFFALIWNGFLVAWHGIALSTGAWFMSAFGLIHTGVGLFLIYYVAALFVNSTVIRASPRGLESKSGPLPWKGDRQLGAGTVSQIYRLFEGTGILASPTTVNPDFLALRSDPMALSGASRRKQSPSSGDSMVP